MFSNFIYFLVALVIYTTSELFDKPSGLDPGAIGFCLVSTAVFALVCRIYFNRLSRLGKSLSPQDLDQRVNTAVSRLSIAALVLFAVNIYGFRVNQLLSDVPVFQWVPTLGAILFLGLFLFYLIVIWNFVYRIQKPYFGGSLTKKSFILSNVAFCLPALVPWFFLSLLADCLGLLPFDGLNRFFNSTSGEVVYILFFVIAVSVFGPVLIQRLWGCRPLKPGLDRQRIERICQMADLKYRDILVWNLFGGGMITAGVMGIVGRFRYILVTPALLTCLDEDEIQGVILHEIGHVYHRHMLFYLFFFAGFIACNFVFFEPLMLMIYLINPLYDGASFLGLNQNTAHAAVTCLVLIGLFVLYFRFIFGLFMRHFERQADLHIFEYKDSPSALISTFYKIASLSRQSMDKPNWHHFSIGRRIRFLEKCWLDPKLITSHHRKVKKMIAGYILAVGAVFFLGYSLSYGELNSSFSRYATGKILSRQLELDPDNSDLYVQVGDFYYDARNYEKAVVAYENVLKIDPVNVHALNNLAWLLATCPDKAFRNAPAALDLAGRAVDIRKEAYILDTYAEALYANNLKSQALATAKQALLASTERKQYYRDQVARFEKEL
ncbi:M48 family metalloprotease [uncultured Desulfobacter sp.]|uniref:M48 family metalloprotease n=1 Tax=uncultured Desulfobacter sp. TaxID=240139 RepID=UPI002AAA8A4C|nr:M48 family metalloprotease [uncultured Desulfobacter sp.]